MKHLAILLTLVLSTLNIDMYQDRTDHNKTVILIENNGMVETFSVKNSEINDKLVEKLVRRYEKPE